jgi:hypothetical protein
MIFTGYIYVKQQQQQHAAAEKIQQIHNALYTSKNAKQKSIKYSLFFPCFIEQPFYRFILSLAARGRFYLIIHDIVISGYKMR